MENETLIAENVEVDMETLADAMGQGYCSHIARWAVINVLIEALYPEDRKRLEDYRKQ